MPGRSVNRHRPLLASSIVLALFISVFLPAGPTSAGSLPRGPRGSGETDRILVPIGGGYAEAALEGFARLVMRQASGPVVNIDVVPSAYGQKPSIGVNARLAQDRTRQIQQACRQALVFFPRLSDCRARLIALFTRKRAEMPAYADAFEDPELDGVFILGGVQSFAMQVLAGTPTEEAMAGAYGRGVVYGGTSAGNAVESKSMIWGFTKHGSADAELQRRAVLVWWSDDGSSPPQRGLEFGSRRMIFDQHFYERGRFGRLVNVIAQSDDHFSGESRLGVGIDRDTGVWDRNDALLPGVFGASSVAVIDYETDQATHSWERPNNTLSARHVLTHIIPPLDQVSYDVRRRVPLVNGSAVPFSDPGPWSSGLLRAPGRGDLILGGDVSADTSGAGVGPLVARASATGKDLLLTVFAGYGSAEAAARDAALYRGELESAGWTGRVQRTLYPWNGLPSGQLGHAAGVLLVGGDQAAIDRVRRHPAFRAFVRDAVSRAPVVMTDHAMTAVMGDWFVANPDPASLSAESIANFRFGHDVIQEGLHILPGAAFEPRLTADYRWGRLYALTMKGGTVAFGISQATSIVLTPDGPARVDGHRSVVSLDGRRAAFSVGDNGAFMALNELVNVYAPRDEVTNG